MFLLLASVAVVLLFVLVIWPAIWSGDATRRGDARQVLEMILTAFGRRPLD